MFQLQNVYQRMYAQVDLESNKALSDMQNEMEAIHLNDDAKIRIIELLSEKVARDGATFKFSATKTFLEIKKDSQKIRSEFNFLKPRANLKDQGLRGTTLTQSPPRRQGPRFSPNRQSNLRVPPTANPVVRNQTNIQQVGRSVRANTTPTNTTTRTTPQDNNTQSRILSVLERLESRICSLEQRTPLATPLNNIRVQPMRGHNTQRGRGRGRSQRSQHGGIY